MLFVSLLMSWYATKLQQAKAQKKAVAEILAAAARSSTTTNSTAGANGQGRQGPRPGMAPRVARARLLRHGCACERRVDELDEGLPGRG